MRAKIGWRAVAIGALAAAIAAVGLGTQTGTAATACTPKNNIEAILDDSGSMAGFDSSRQRKEGIELLISKSGNQKKTLGAVEFGSDAATLFTPLVIGPNKASISSTLNTRIQADDGSTNYNAAFDRAKADNPNATARIFLTDGGHNAGAYANGHAGGPPTFVIGFGSSTAGAAGQRLQQIANETGGVYFPQTDANNIKAVINKIDAALNCVAVTTEFVDQLATAGATANHAFKPQRSTKSLEMTLTWLDPNNQIDVQRIQIVNRGKVVAVSKRSKRKRTKLRITRTSGPGFLTLKVRRLKRGKVKFKLRAKTLATPTSVTTQVTESNRR